MWQATTTPVRRGQQTTVGGPDGALSFDAVLDLWASSTPFRAWFTQQLAAAPFGAYRWETPPITQNTLDRPFEYVLIDNPSLERTPDPNAFSEHFGGPKTITAFPNLRGDAMMVVPHPKAAHAVYTHLAAFLRGAPEAQQHALWQTTARAVRSRLSAQPLWLSTAGMGVAWLHVRLDSRPKYYAHTPYMSADG